LLDAGAGHLKLAQRMADHHEERQAGRHGREDVYFVGTGSSRASEERLLQPPRMRLADTQVGAILGMGPGTVRHYGKQAQVHLISIDTAAKVTREKFAGMLL